MASTAGGGSLAGRWSGIIDGPEMATASGRATIPVRLTVRGDGTWTMTVPGSRMDGAARLVEPGTLVLAGRVSEPGAAPAGAAVSYTLRQAGPGWLLGSADTFFAGHRVTAGIQLEKLAEPVPGITSELGECPAGDPRWTCHDATS